MKCIGCDKKIPWDGKGLFSYTCPCGSHIFYEENPPGDSPQLYFPASLVIAIKTRSGLPHIDYLIGSSGYTSRIKEAILQHLVKEGCIWMKDCPECLANGTYARSLEREKHLAVQAAQRILATGAEN